MTNDDKALVERLRTKYCCSDWADNCNCDEAANRIEAQAAEIEALKTLLAATAQVTADHFKTAKERAAEIEALKRDHASAVAELNKTKALLKGYRRGFKNARKGATE